MSGFKTAMLAVTGSCVLSLAACGSGSESQTAANTGGSTGGGATGGGSSPPASPTGQQPQLFIEHDPDGAPYLRVQEQAWDALGGAAQRTIADRTLGPSPGVNFVVEGAQNTRISNVDAVQMKYGLTMQQSAQVSIYDYTYTQFDGAGGIYGAAVKLGDNQRPTDGSTWIQRVVADGMQTPDGTYKISNTDFIGIEQESGPIYIRDVTGKNFGDAGVDTKSTQVYIMNATLDDVHRGLRAWPGVEIILVNSIINPAEGHQQGWVYDGTATVRYWNTLWCENSAAPSKDDPKCRSTPWIIEGDQINASVAQARFIPLSSNPLPGVSPFFNTSIDEIAVQYSTDGGSTWKALQLANTGGPGAAPVGDPRFALPLDLDNANYLFRAQYKKNGAATGSWSQAIDESGAAK